MNPSLLYHKIKIYAQRLLGNSIAANYFLYFYYLLLHQISFIILSNKTAKKGKIKTWRSEHDSNVRPTA